MLQITPEYMVICETPFVEMRRCDQAQALLIRWKQQPDAITFISSYLAGLEYLENNQPLRCFCTDMSGISSFSRELEVWLSSDYYPKVYNIIKGGFFAAVVFSEEHFKALIANYHLSAHNQQHEYVHFNYFTLQEEALDWLRSIKKDEEPVVLPQQV